MDRNACGPSEIRAGNIRQQTLEMREKEGKCTDNTRDKAEMTSA